MLEFVKKMLKMILKIVGIVVAVVIIFCVVMFIWGLLDMESADAFFQAMKRMN